MHVFNWAKLIWICLKLSIQMKPTTELESSPMNNRLSKQPVTIITTIESKILLIWVQINFHWICKVQKVAKRIKFKTNLNIYLSELKIKFSGTFRSKCCNFHICHVPSLFLLSKALKELLTCICLSQKEFCLLNKHI